MDASLPRFQAAASVLGVHPAALLDDIYNSTLEYLCDSADALQLSIEAQAAAAPGDVQAAIPDLVDQINVHLQAKLDRQLRTMEAFALKNVLLLPPDLDIHRGAPNRVAPPPDYIDDAAPEQEALLDQERVNLLARIQVAKEVNAFLKCQLAAEVSAQNTIEQLGGHVLQIASIVPQLKACIDEVEAQVEEYSATSRQISQLVSQEGQVPFGSIATRRCPITLSDLAAFDADRSSETPV